MNAIRAIVALLTSLFASACCSSLDKLVDPQRAVEPAATPVAYSPRS